MGEYELTTPAVRVKVRSGPLVVRKIQRQLRASLPSHLFMHLVLERDEPPERRRTRLAPGARTAVPLRGRKAERAFKQIMESVGWTVHHALPNSARRGGSWFTNSNDTWGCVDLAGACPIGFWLVQVTTPNGVSEKKRKMEKVAWPLGTDGVFVCIAESRAEWAGRRVVHWFRLHRLTAAGWTTGYPPLEAR